MPPAPHSMYRQATATSWTRIDMLIALYDATVISVERGSEAVQTQDAESLARDRVRAQRLLTELIAGVDLEQGELPENIHRLLSFCLHQICGPTAEEWTSALSVLRQLQDAFRSIRDQAVQLERTGQIPTLQNIAAEPTLAIG